MLKKTILFSLALPIALVAQPATASTPVDLHAVKMSSACFDVLMNHYLFRKQRDAGLPLDEALKMFGAPDARFAVPAQAIRHAYAYRHLNTHFLDRYAVWTCSAAEHKIPIRPIAELADDAEKCYSAHPKTPFDHPCFLALRIKALHLPPDYLEPVARPTPAR